MRKIFLLTKIMLKSGGIISDKRGRSRWVVPAILVFAFAVFAFSTIMVAFQLYDALAPSNNAGVILPMVFGATCAVIFLFGIFYVISVMYHANDIEMLKYLPLKLHQILGAKFATLVIYEYIFEAFILAPVLIAYAIKINAGAVFIIYSVLLFLITPMIALSMAGIIVMIVMRFTSFGKNKQAFRFVGGILAMVLALGFNVLIQTSVANMGKAQLLTAFQNSTLADTFGRIFPGTSFASGALINYANLDGLLNLILFMLCSLAAVAVFIGFGELLYLKGVAGITEISAKRKQIKDLGKETESASAMSAYIKKEVRLLLRSPIAFLNCVLMTFIWPVLLVIIFFSGGSRISAITGAISQMNEALLIAILVGASAFISSANAITSTAISREGKSLYFTKYIPMSMQNQLTAKTITGMIFSGISVVLLMIVGAVLGVNIGIMLISLVIGLIVMAACSYAGLLIDVANPKLEWINEQQAIKQNLNVVLHMLIGLFLAAIAIVPAVVFNMSAIVVIIYNTAVFLLLLIILQSYVRNRAASKLMEMDV